MSFLQIVPDVVLFHLRSVRKFVNFVQNLLEKLLHIIRCATSIVLELNVFFVFKHHIVNQIQHVRQMWNLQYYFIVYVYLLRRRSYNVCLSKEMPA